MSDEETFEKINDDVENIDNEQDALIIQELIALVERNPPLYAKNWKEYAGKNFCKDLAWENGSNLSRQMSGKLHIYMYVYHLICLHDNKRLG